ncbi:hypothetical protein ABT009_46325 [Streptomyces sp. NPDC002896]|uniref:hypothetical protein n=1 Tax=Streptomyces sp. NPDC002896 TaxID=3154438 RepID=UPI0033218491
MVDTLVRGGVPVLGDEAGAHLVVDPGVNVLEMQHEHDAVPRLDLGDSWFPFLPGGQNESADHTSVTFDDPGSRWDAMGNLDHSENYSKSMNNSADPGYLAYEQSLRDSGFLMDPDSSGSDVTAVDVHGGRKH